MSCDYSVRVNQCVNVTGEINLSANKDCFRFVLSCLSLFLPVLFVRACGQKHCNSETFFLLNDSVTDIFQAVPLGFGGSLDYVPLGKLVLDDMKCKHHYIPQFRIIHCYLLNTVTRQFFFILIAHSDQNKVGDIDRDLSVYLLL